MLSYGAKLIKSKPVTIERGKSIFEELQKGTKGTDRVA